MDLRKIFLFGKKKKSVQVKKINKLKSPDIGEMAAGNLSAVSNSISQMMEQQNIMTKILVVQDGRNSAVLEDYAVKMAHKLDCEIVALDVSNEPLMFDGERRRRETHRFLQRAEQNAKSIHIKADALSVKFQHIAKIGDQDETIKTLSQEDKCIRYVLTKPLQEKLGADQKRARVPVFDLSCSRL
jgi:hypothetical protein